MVEQPQGATDEPQQDTKPKRGKSTRIPVPSREDVFGDLRKVAPPVPPPKAKPKRRNPR